MAVAATKSMVIPCTGRQIYIHSYTGAAALSEALAPGTNFRLLEVRIHLNAAGTSGTLTVTKDSTVGTAYDLLLASQDMTAITDYQYQPTRPIPFQRGDEIDVVWANANKKTYGLEIVIEVL